MYTHSQKLSSLLFLFALIPVLCTSQITEPETGKSYLLIHSSGKVAGANSESRAELQNFSGGQEQQLQFIPDGSGYYLLKRQGQNLYLALSGNWNTYFIDDASADQAKYAIEKISDSYVALKCKANLAYLGTDNITAGSSIFSDKSGTDSKHHWYISTQYHEPYVDTIHYSISPNAVYDKVFEGWGVSLCWWANMCGSWNDSKINEIVDWLVSPDGLNYNIFRYNIGGGDDPLNRNCDPHHMASGKGIRAEMEGFKDGTNSGYNWTRDATQRKIMLKIKEKRPDAIFEAFSNSAPYYMTYSGCSAGNRNASDDNLKPEFYEEFAHYLVDVCKHYKDEYGIEFKTLDPFNEPVTNYWGANGGQEGCHFSTEAQIAFLKILAPVLKESGLSTIISSADETSVAQQATDVKSYESSGVLQLVGQINTHTYTADNMSRVNLRALSTHHNKPLWMSEVGAGGSGISGNLNLAQKLMNDIHYLRPEAWVDWQYIEEGNDQWCLVKGNFGTQAYQRIKNYYIRQQFSKYIRKGSSFIFTPNEQMLASLSPNKDSLVLVLMNNSSSRIYHQADLSGFPVVEDKISASRTSEQEDNTIVADFKQEGKQLLIKIPAYSITTITIPVGKTEADKKLKTGVPYQIISRSSNAAAQAVNGSVKILNYRDADSSQTWQLVATEQGYNITNLNGEKLTDDGGYFAQAISSQTDGQSFKLEALGDDCYKIISLRSGKSLDLQGESNASGTNVGFYDYGSNPAAGHRQWLLYELPTGDRQIEITISLIKGWNLISLPVTAEDMSIHKIFPNASIVKNDTSFFSAEQPSFCNSLTEIKTGKGYLLYNTKKESIIINGLASSTTTLFNSLRQGWSLIGCPSTTPVLLEEAFGSNLQTMKILKNFEGYWSAGDANSSIKSLEPGNAYFIYGN